MLEESVFKSNRKCCYYDYLMLSYFLIHLFLFLTGLFLLATVQLLSLSLLSTSLIDFVNHFLFQVTTNSLFNFLATVVHYVTISIFYLFLKSYIKLHVLI